MDMRIPFNISAESMQDYDKTRGKVFEPEAIRALTDQKKAKILIIAMTANAFEEDRKMALSKGMNGYIAKLIDVKNMEEVLMSVLRQ